MSNHLFPVKLYSILRHLMDTKPFDSRLHPIALIQPPDDGKLRMVLLSSEVHHAVPSFEGHDKHGLRKRLAIPTDMPFIAIDEVMFEIYEINGKLIYSVPLIRVTGYMAAAIEVELLSMLLEVKGMKIDMM